MAVVQISRIQIRRGKITSGTGLPQLASGELAWAVDTQELYIGNGAVSEGSPAVGNTKILTLNDLTQQGNILSLLEYDYKSDDSSIVTGTDQNNPTTRILQYKLDDVINAKDFGVIGDGLQDDTVCLQRAIDQLFLNAAGASADYADLRVSLILPPGTFKTTDTLYIPSYATIIGAGADKSIINYDPATPSVSPAIQFINDTSTIGNPSTIITTLGNNQPRNIHMSGLTVTTASGLDVAMKLDCVRDSVFADITLRGTWDGNLTTTSVGLEMNALQAAVTTENNLFKNIKFYNFNYAVNAKYDIRNNQFNNGYVEECYQGFVLGDNANGTTVGQQHGPRETTIVGYKFYRIMRQAIYAELGSKNSTKSCTYINVGNSGSNNAGAIYPQVYYRDPGNTSVGDKSDRHSDLADNSLFTIYVPEFAGRGTYTPDVHYGEIPLSGSTGSTYALAFRLACNTNAGGVPGGAITYSLSYQVTSAAPIPSTPSKYFTRRGVMTVSAFVASTNSTSSIQLSDDFDFAGPDITTLQTSLDFKAVFLDQSNVICTSPSQTPVSIGIYYTNPYGGASGDMYYSYSAIL